MLTLSRNNQALSPFDNLVQGLVRQPLLRDSQGVSAATPAADVVANSTEYRFQFDIPGVAKDAIQIDVEDRQLTVSGERLPLATAEDQVTWRNERSAGKFSRGFRLPNDADLTNISARYDNGVLEVVVPKAESAKARRIEIAS